MSVFTGTQTHKEINNLDVDQRVRTTCIVSEHVTDAHYSLDPTLENYDDFLARIHTTNDAARKLYRAASSTDDITACQMRTVASSIWDRNLSDFQARFLSRAKL